MASASVTPTSSAEELAAAATGQPRDHRRRQTTQLKQVPDTKPLREQIRAKCQAVAARLDKSHPLSKDAMESVARATLAEMELPDSYVGWTMVMLASEFWRDQVAAVPPSRRLFLLPHCLRHEEKCPAHYDEFGLDCKSCGACSIGDFRTTAQQMGYRVLVAEGSPIVMKIILSGYVDAILGVACSERAGEGDRQDPAGRHSLHGRAAVVEQVQGNLRRRGLGPRDGSPSTLAHVALDPHLRAPHACRVGPVQ